MSRPGSGPIEPRPAQQPYTPPAHTPVAARPYQAVGTPAKPEQLPVGQAPADTKLVPVQRDDFTKPATPAGATVRVNTPTAVTITKPAGSIPPAPVPAPKIPREQELLQSMGNLDVHGAENGTFIKVETPFGNALVRDTRATDVLKPTLHQSALKIPFWAFEAMLAFFRRIYKKQSTEVVVLLYYNRQSKDWQVVVPHQTTSGGQATYDLRAATPVNLTTGLPADIDPSAGWIFAGSCHSHCMMDAFWSSSDDANELGKNGIHCTFGRIMDPMPDLACSVVVRRVRFVVEPERVFEMPTSNVQIPPSAVALVGEDMSFYTTTYSSGGRGWQFDPTGFDDEGPAARTPGKSSGASSNGSNRRARRRGRYGEEIGPEGELDFNGSNLRGPVDPPYGSRVGHQRVDRVRVGGTGQSTQGVTPDSWEDDADNESLNWYARHGWIYNDHTETWGPPVPDQGIGTS